jgi:sugar/nucleoside kinase (ribokinase family)
VEEGPPRRARRAHRAVRAHHGRRHPPPPPAGDTFIGATLYALACGADADEALRCACAVAGAKVGRAGFDGLAADVTFRPAPRE